MIYKIIAGAVAGGIVGALISRFGKCAGGGCPLTSNPIVAIVIWAIIGGMIASSIGARPKNTPPPSSQESATTETSIEE